MCELSHSTSPSLPGMKDPNIAELTPSLAPVPVPPPRPDGRSLAAGWPLRDFLELGPLPTAVPCARLHARLLIRDWGLTALASNVEILVSELVTNAVHASRVLGQASPVRLWRTRRNAMSLLMGSAGASRRSVSVRWPGPTTDLKRKGMTDLIDEAPAVGVRLSICESGLRAAHAPAGPVSRARRWFVVADGKRLRQLRQEHRLSQEMLASRAGISVGTIGQLERQAHPSCRGRTLARLAAALGEQPTTLMPSPP